MHRTPSNLHPPPSIDEEYPPTPSPRSHAVPVSPWIRKPDAERPAHLILLHGPPGTQLLSPDPDLEPGTPDDHKDQKRKICGCSKPTFIILVFLLIVVVAAAVGGGVGGTIFAQNRKSNASVDAGD